MKLLLVNVTCNQGSTGKIAWDLAVWDRENGHQAVVCYGRGPDSGIQGAVKIARDWETHAHALRTRLTGYAGVGSAGATRRLIRELEAFGPDVVHLHNIHGYYVHAYRLLQYLKERRIPTVITLHDEWLFTGKCGHPHDCAGWRSGCGNCPQLGIYPKSLLFDRSAAEFRWKQELFSNWGGLKLAAVSGWLKERAAQSPILEGKSCRVIPNGVDLATFRPTPSEHLREKYRLEGRTVLLHVTPGFSDPEKGGRFVVELARRLADLPLVVAVVGLENPSGDLPQNLLPIPHTENKGELATWYSMAHALLITSRMESLPTVCLESLCCGTPVIGFENGGAEEAAPSPYGRLVPHGDMEGLEQAARDSLGVASMPDSGDCAAFGASHYGKEQMASAYLEYYKEVVA